MKFALLTSRFWQPLIPWLKAFGAFKGKMWFGLSCALLAAFSGIGLLAVSGWFITASAFAGILGFGLVFNIYIPGAGVRLFALTRTVARYFERLLQHDFILSLQSSWRVMLFKRYVALPFEQQASEHTATQVQRLTGDLNALEGLWLGWLSPALVAAFSLLMVVLLLAIWSIPLALILLLGCVVMALFLMLLSEETFAAQQRSYRQQEDIQRRALDWLNGLAELSAWGLAKDQGQNLVMILRAQMQEKLKISAAANRTKALLTVLHALMVLIVAAWSAWMWQMEQLSGPVAVLLALAVLALGEVIAPLAGQFAQAGHMRQAARALDVEKNSVGEQQRPQEIHFHEGAVQFHQFILQQGERRLLHLDSLRLSAGEQMTLAAASGAGKSRFAHAIVAAGRAQGVNIQYLTQQNYLFAGTLRQNLAFILPDLTDEDAFRVLQQVDLLSWVMTSPDGLDMDLGEDANRVSGGQARRIALARILLLDPDVVVMDEPFTGVDDATRRIVLNRITPWLKGRTAFFFAHDKGVLPAAHRHYILYNQGFYQLDS